MPTQPTPPSPASDPGFAPLRLCVRRTTVVPARGPGERAVEISLRVPTDLTVVEEAVDLVARYCLVSGLPSHTARF